MYKRFPLSGSGYTIRDVEKVAEEVTGAPLDDFFDKYIFGTDPLPWEKTLAYAGLDVVQKDSIPKPRIGLGVSDMNGRPTVTQVTAGSPAYKAGVDFDDELVAMNGFRVQSSDFADRIREHAIGDTVVLTVLHNDKLKTINVILEAAPLLSYRITKTKNPTALQTSIYEDWLNAKWDEGKK
jgi:predicted metalloprotease with PDZ domain